MLGKSRKSLRNRFSTRETVGGERGQDQGCGGRRKQEEREVREVKDREEGTSAVLLHSQRLAN